MRRVSSAGLILCLAALSGCGTMKRLSVTVMLDPEMTKDPAATPTVEVNLVGINKSELPQWKAYSMSEYWSPGNKLRTGAEKHVVRFAQTLPSKHMLDRKNPIFQKWQDKTASHLCVLADLPDMMDSKPGQPDPRRMILPLHPKAWKADSITITIKAGQMVCSPAPRRGM